MKTPSTENEANYKKMKLFTEKHVDKAKREYYTKYFKKFSGDSKMQWKMVNTILNRAKKAKIKVKKLNFQGNEITDSQQIANVFNDYFCNVAENLKRDNGLASSDDHVIRTEASNTRCQQSMNLAVSEPNVGVLNSKWRYVRMLPSLLRQEVNMPYQDDDQDPNGDANQDNGR